MSEEKESFESSAAALIAREHRRRRVAVASVAIVVVLGAAAAIGTGLASKAKRDAVAAQMKAVKRADSAVVRTRDIERELVDFANNKVNYVIGIPDSGTALDSVWPEASQEVQPGQSHNSQPIYNFQLWLSGSETQLSRIRHVTYWFDHPTFERKRYDAEHASDGFKMEYSGWGALDVVTIQVELIDGVTYPIYFNMARFLGR